MPIKPDQVAIKEIAYWPDGYFIADIDASEQGEILDSVDAFGQGRHALLSVPLSASHEVIQALVCTKLIQVSSKKTEKSFNFRSNPDSL